MDKRERAAVFRARLQAGMKQAGITQSALARQAQVDRSTLSQLIKDDGARLPNGQLVAACAAVLGVSADWLLGLSDLPEQAQDLVANAISMTQAQRALVDEKIFAWHQEAEGYKIRHVPAALPDMLKTDDILRWEYAPSLGKTTEQAMGASNDRLEWMRSARSDYEIAIPLAEVESFARGDGYYRDLSPALRRPQLEKIRDLHAQLYPTLRLHFFDQRKLYSAPVTIFGPLLAVIYIGQNYLVFRDTERVAAITAHFDELVRAASISQRDIGTYFDQLIAKMG
ncbi:helix-turn-helix domain-containing protein [Roseobacter sp. CCS2]|uniref:helix-turn-helix domain-containing protein n=1 Tax=Roseobacter sp. CCS2 TaxID=391593 RepID=UPI0000F3E53C|nr:DNA binding protein, putative [Roseobacter sp. CCS2]